jgi:hypothetical protein
MLDGGRIVLIQVRCEADAVGGLLSVIGSTVVVHQTISKKGLSKKT